VESGTEIYTIVDLSTVWVNLTVYLKDLASVHPDQDIELMADHSGARVKGEISLITPFVEKSTRSATARVILNNSGGLWLPGTFVTGNIRGLEENIRVVIPNDAVQSFEGQKIVFVEDNDGFKMNPVVLGRADHVNVEIIDGLDPGERYVVQGAFEMKATVLTRNMDSHAGHGH
jgi:cobalt-zinc-cadmium efflux system membrane fusion protein